MSVPLIESVRARLQDFGLDPMGARMVVGVFLEQTPAYLDALERALADGRVDELRRWCHTLQGAVANVGLTASASRCRELQGAVKASAAPATDEDVARMTMTLVEETRAEIDALRRWYAQRG
ncbi:MAG: Hpt domain-containing protein [Myxococcales bacterium]|nr:Hpt domain-containing protein [Myxococcales bacterium]